MNKITAVIIDDESFNHNLIRSLVSQLHPGFSIVGEAASVAEGYALISRLNPQVVFLDIRMPDGNGFELLNRFDNIPFEVVFISGFDEYALKAFDHNALDYVLKPINLGKFSDTLRKVQSRVESRQQYLDQMKHIVGSYDPREAIITKIPIHYNDRVLLLPVNEVLYIRSSDGCTCFHRGADEKHISARQLSDFEFILENFPNFIRITKGAYINLNFMTGYSKGFDCTVTMSDGSVHEISRRKKTQVLEAIHNGWKTKA